MKPVETYTIRPSSLEALECRLRYDWAVRQHYVSIRPNDALEFGTAIHVALEKYYASGSDPVKVFQHWMDEKTIDVSKFQSGAGRSRKLGPRELGSRMMQNYVAEYARKEPFDIIATEQEISRAIPIPRDEPKVVSDPSKRFFLATRIDAIVYNRVLGSHWVLEHKTFERFYPGQLDQNHQFVIEKFVAEGWLKAPIAGVIYNGLWKRDKATPAQPRLFQRHPIHINERQVEVMLHRIYWQLKDLASPNYRVYPEPSSLKCQYCSFRQPCTEYMRGGDWSFLLENTYKQVDPRSLGSAEVE